MQMRLGKTLVAIRRIRLYSSKPQKVLVVAPNSALGSWVEELERESETYLWLKGTRAERLKLITNIHDGDTPNPTYYLLNKEGFLSIPEVKGVLWDVLVLDESTFIKNPKAQVTKFFTNNFKDVKHKFILTGTPNPETDLDYVCQFIFLNGSFLGCKNYWDFRTKYYIPDENGWKWIPKPGVQKLIQDEVGRLAFVLRRRDAGLEREKVFQKRGLDFPPEIRNIYDKAEKDFMLELAFGSDRSTVWTTQKYIWLRQLCGGFADGNLIWSGKVHELLDLLNGELKGESVVIWFAYNQEMKVVLKALNKEKVACIRGDIPLENREFHRRRFQAGETRILLIQEACARAGLNLSRADTAIYFSEPVSMETRMQTEDRILSLDKTGPLLYISLLVENTVDIDIHQAMAVKGLRSDISLSKSLTASIGSRLK